VDTLDTEGAFLGAKKKLTFAIDAETAAETAITKW
jgi:hypothetical protein